jgi:hypothetical protein
MVLQIWHLGKYIRRLDHNPCLFLRKAKINYKTIPIQMVLQIRHKQKDKKIGLVHVYGNLTKEEN